MRCGGWALALKRGNCGCLANEQGLPVRSQGSSSRETVAQLSSWRHVMPRPGLGTPERPEWELGAGGQEPKDRSFEAVSDAVSSAEERKQSQPPSSSEGKKKRLGWGWCWEGSPRVEPSPANVQPEWLETPGLSPQLGVL